MKYTHYAPSVPVRILRGTVSEIEAFLEKRENAGVLTFDEFNLNTKAKQISLGSINNPKECAKNLFRSLRDMDKLGVSEIFAPEIGTDGLWSAIKNRLYKSAGGNIINALDKEIIFVCTGNTCRSPMAEGFFNALPNKGYWGTSAGIFAQNGEKASENSVLAMKENGVDIKSHYSKMLTPNMINRADLILTMTNSHKNALLSIDGSLSGKVMTFSEFSGEEGEIPDPFGGDLDTYRSCAKEIKRLVKKAYDRL